MNIIYFLLANWDSVLVVLAFVVLCVVLVKRGETKILKHILFNLVTQAEREFGSGTGALKYAAVSDWIYQRLPAVLKLLFTEKDIDTMIEAALTEAKKQWGANENVKNYIEAPAIIGGEDVSTGVRGPDFHSVLSAGNRRAARSKNKIKKSCIYLLTKHEVAVVYFSIDKFFAMRYIKKREPRILFIRASGLASLIQLSRF